MSGAPTGDFDTYVGEHPLRRAAVEPGWVRVVWTDGHHGRFHHVWLRDNCPCPACVHQGTREQMFELPSVATDLRASAAGVSDDVLVVHWADDGGHVSRYDGAWLRAHCYSDDADADGRVATVVTTWDGTTLAAPPTFDGPAVLADDDALYELLVALRDTGCALLRGLATEPHTVGEVVTRIGPVRETNFGVLWDVIAEPDPISNANTALPLPPHVDLPTRERQPGLQFLHCVVNEAEGGESILVDGFRLAEVARIEQPDHYEVLTTLPWNWANRSTTSDHRWSAPPIIVDHTGAVTEVRAGNWLRAPLTDVPFDRVEAAYAAYRWFLELSYDPRFQVRFRLDAGDLMAFDNRRVLHARAAFDGAGRRRLRGCYSEREELTSRLRMLDRSRREQAAATRR